MVTSEEIDKIEIIDDRSHKKEQKVVPLSQAAKIKKINDSVQDKYKKEGKYKPFDNKPEEKVGEIWVYEELTKELPEWNINTDYMDISSLDITLIHKTKRYVIKIEVKTKPEEAENYIYKFLNDKVDRSAGVPEYKIGQVLEADYVIWLMTSKFGDVLNQYTASSSSVVGISRKEELKMSDFTVNVASSKYYYLDLTKIRLGMSSITELSRDIRMRYP